MNALTVPTSARPPLRDGTVLVVRGTTLGLKRRLPFAGLLGPLLLLAFWAAASATQLIDPRILPSPLTVVQTAWRMTLSGVLPWNLWVSMTRALTGLAFGTVIGVVLALIAGLTKTGNALIDGNVQIWRSIPNLAILPLAIVWLGIGEQMKITLITMSVIVPIYINTAAAIAGVDKRFVDLADTLKLDRWTFIRRIALPGAIPGFFVGFRLASVFCWLVLVVVEQVNAMAGIGYFMANARTYGQIDVIAVGLVLYALLGTGSDALVRIVERRTLRWRRSLG